MTPAPNLNAPLGSFVRLWKNWVTPHAVERDEQFRERTIRGIIVIWIAVLVGFATLATLLTAWTRFSQIFVTVLFAIPTYLAVRRQQITLASWILVLQSIAFAMFSLIQVGYWAPGTFAADILALLLATILLPVRHVRMVPFILIALYGGGAFWLDAQGIRSPLPASTPYAAPLPATFAFTLIILFLWGASSYFLNELTSQRQELKELVNTLEQRVEERTIELRRTNEQLQLEINERRQIEAALRQSESQLRAILETLPIPLIVATSQDNFLYVNPVAVQLFKLDGSERINVAHYLRLEDADQRRVGLLLQEQGYIHDLEAHFTTAEGVTRIGLISIQPFQFSGQAAYLIAIVDITDLKAVQEAERRQRNLTEALLDSALMLTSSLHLDEVVGNVLSNLHRVIPHDVANILILDGEYGTVLGLKNHLTDAQYEIVRQRVRIQDEYYHYQMLQTHQPVVLDDISQDPHFVRISRSPVIRSFLGFPILVGQEIIGFFNLGSQEAKFFSEAHIQVLRMFAIQAGIAIQNARLFKQAQTIAALEERNKLARDLHDSVTQTLFAANSIAEALPQLIQMNSTKVNGYIQDLHQLTRGAMAEMRSLLVELRPEALIHTELNILLSQLCDVFTGKTQIEVERQLTKKMMLPAERQVVFYRVAQEALNNIAKHAEASQVKINLSRTEEAIELRVCDNGRGFDAKQVSAEHFGLKIMHERATEIGANLDIHSKPGHGTEIILRSNIL